MADRGVPGDYHTIGLEGTFPRGKEEGEEGRGKRTERERKGKFKKKVATSADARSSSFSRGYGKLNSSRNGARRRGREGEKFVFLETHLS